MTDLERFIREAEGLKTMRRIKYQVLDHHFVDSDDQTVVGVGECFIEALSDALGTLAQSEPEIDPRQIAAIFRMEQQKAEESSKENSKEGFEDFSYYVAIRYSLH